MELEEGMSHSRPRASLPRKLQGSSWEVLMSSMVMWLEAYPKKRGSLESEEIDCMANRRAEGKDLLVAYFQLVFLPCGATTLLTC